MDPIVNAMRRVGLVLLLVLLPGDLLLGVGTLAGQAAVEPAGLYLTWRRDPTTTMTIDWHTNGPIASPTLEYRERGTQEWQRLPAASHPLPHSEIIIHRVEVSGLQPATEYEFRCEQNGRVFLFRTMPATLDRPVRFIAGGDVRHNRELMEKTTRQVPVYDPDFVMLGGDLAYANGMPDQVWKWPEWFDVLKQDMIMPNGRVIPILVAIGNHEVRGGYYFNDDHERRVDLPPYAGNDASRATIAPFFYALFAMPGQPGYNVLDFGDYMSVILLDTDHTNPIEGEQTRWLESVLADRRQVPHIFPIYHVTAFPSVRAFDGRTETRVREHWVPLFERYGVRVVFENHDHTYKRTFPLRQNRISVDGIVYIGDGAWGVSTRQIGAGQDGERPWYLARGESVRHFIVATIHGPHQHFLMVDEDGNVFDEYPRTPNRRLHTYDEEETVPAVATP
jgi:acid phosphatase type 7